MTATASTRSSATWALALAALVGSSFGWVALWAASSWAVYTASWLSAGFLASIPLAAASLTLARGQPHLKAPARISLVAIFLFAGVWVAFLAFKLAA